MTPAENESLRCPIGKFCWEGTVTGEQVAEAPWRLSEAVDGLSDDRLDTPYRPGGWTVRQVVHHLADSHLNSYVRFRPALTEDEPLIKTCNEARWAGLPGAGAAPPGISLELLGSLHRRWVALLEALSGRGWDRRFRHPELGVRSLRETLALHAWHGRHQVAHITSLRARMGW